MLRNLYIKWVSPQRWLERAGVRAPMQIVIGLVLLTVCVLLIARDLKLLPSQEDELQRTRTVFAEMASHQTAFVLLREDNAQLRNLLEGMTGKDDVLSVCLRKWDGTVVAQTSDHAEHWAGAAEQGSTLTHIRVMLQRGNNKWGELEIAFSAPPTMTSWQAWWSTSTVRLIAFVLAAVFILFWLFLSRMLTMLDPSSVIPNRMQLLMDTLVEGLIVLDDQGYIVMVNQSFSRTAFLSTEQLIGRKLSSLPWAARDGGPETLPWETANAVDMQERGVPMRLRIGTRHGRRLNVNVSPILGPDGKRRGVLITFDDQTAIEEDNLQLSTLLTRFGNASDQIRELRQSLLSEVNQSDLEILDELAKVAGELANLSRSATQDKKTLMPLQNVEEPHPFQEATI